MLRILYVEDNAANLSLLHRVARIGGHEVVNRTTGEAALADFDDLRPDLVLMDIQLEGVMDGLEVVRELRRKGYTVPIVAVTAYAMKGDAENALSAGCDSYLPKPIPIQDLVNLVNRYENEVEKRKTGELKASKTASTAAKDAEKPSKTKQKPASDATAEMSKPNLDADVPGEKTPVDKPAARGKLDNDTPSGTGKDGSKRAGAQG